MVLVHFITIRTKTVFGQFGPTEIESWFIKTTQWDGKWLLVNLVEIVAKKILN